jgi:integrase/recombinase XerD
LNEERVKTFLRWRWKRLVRKSGDQCTLALLLRHLREKDIISPPVTPPLRPIDLIERDYGRFLREERGFMSASVGQYLPVARRFLWNRFRNGKIRLNELRTKDVTDFLLKDSSNRGRRSAQLMTSVLRSFFTYLFEERKTATNLSMAIPATAGGRLSELPRYLEAAQVEKLLRSCDRRRGAGRRDYAILLLLARLGLRGGEVVRLNLEDIDWAAGELLIPSAQGYPSLRGISSAVCVTWGHISKVDNSRCTRPTNPHKRGSGTRRRALPLTAAPTVV